MRGDGIDRALQPCGATSNGGGPRLTWQPARGDGAGHTDGGREPPIGSRPPGSSTSAIARHLVSELHTPEPASTGRLGGCRRFTRLRSVAPCPSHARRQPEWMQRRRHLGRGARRSAPSILPAPPRESGGASPPTRIWPLKRAGRSSERPARSFFRLCHRDCCWGRHAAAWPLRPLDQEAYRSSCRQL